MRPMLFIDILFRWFHVAAACLAIGGAFFMRVVVPAGISQLEPEAKQAAFLRIRRAFKFVVHGAVFFLLLSGIYNVMRAWPWYTQNPPVMHGMFGMHILLGLSVITISVILLSGSEPARSHAGWMKINLVLMALTILAASSLKYVREHTRPPEGVQSMPVKAK